MASHSTRYPRRTVLKGAASGIAIGIALSTPNSISSGSARAAKRASTPRPIIITHSKQAQDLFHIAVTTKRLAITFYSHALLHAAIPDLDSTAQSHLQAILAEEQIHEQYFESLGGRPLTNSFSFPHGTATFSTLRTFLQTQQHLECILASVFLAGVREMADQRQPRLAQILAQIATVEGEHRVVGRTIGITSNQPGFFQPANNQAFAPVLIGRISDLPAILKQEGYLIPTTDNSYIYAPTSTATPGINYHSPFAELDDSEHPPL
jgi:hypothetical protein